MNNGIRKSLLSDWGEVLLQKNWKKGGEKIFTVSGCNELGNYSVI